MYITFPSTSSRSGVFPSTVARVYINNRLRRDAFCLSVELSAGINISECKLKLTQEGYDSKIFEFGDDVEIKVNPYGVIWRGFITGRDTTEFNETIYTAQDLLAHLQDDYFYQDYNYNDRITGEIINTKNMREIALIAFDIYTEWRTESGNDNYELTIDHESFPETNPGTVSVEGMNLLSGLNQALEQLDYRYRIVVEHSNSKSQIKVIKLGTGKDKHFLRGTDINAYPRAQRYGKTNVKSVSKTNDASEVISHVFSVGDNRKIETSVELEPSWDETGLTDAELVDILQNNDTYTKKTLDGTEENPNYKEKYERFWRNYTIPKTNDVVQGKRTETVAGTLSTEERQVPIVNNLVQKDPSTSEDIKSFIVYRRATDAGDLIKGSDDKTYECILSIDNADALVHKPTTGSDFGTYFQEFTTIDSPLQYTLYTDPPEFEDGSIYLKKNDKYYLQKDGFRINDNKEVEFNDVFSDASGNVLLKGSDGEFVSYDSNTKISTYQSSDIDFGNLTKSLLDRGLFLVLPEYKLMYLVTSFSTGGSPNFISVAGNLTDAGENGGIGSDFALVLIRGVTPEGSSFAYSTNPIPVYGQSGQGTIQGEYIYNPAGSEEITNDYAGYSLTLGTIGALASSPTLPNKIPVIVDEPGDTEVYKIVTSSAKSVFVSNDKLDLTDKPTNFQITAPQSLLELKYPYSKIYLNFAYDSNQRLFYNSADLSFEDRKHIIYKENNSYRWETRSNNFDLSLDANNKTIITLRDGSVDDIKQDSELATWGQKQISGQTNQVENYSISLPNFPFEYKIGDLIVDNRKATRSLITRITYNFADQSTELTGMSK